MKDQNLVAALLEDYRAAPLSDADRQMLAYADKLTRAPGEMRAGDVDALRAAGFSDSAILDLNLVVGYFAFVNRLADGLGVPLEEFWTAP